MPSEPQSVGKKMRDEIDAISAIAPERIAGGDGEARALAFYCDRLQKSADYVTREHFTVRPQSFLGWTYIVPTFLIAANVLYFFSPLTALICILLAAVSVFLHFVCYLPILDKLFPKKISSDVYACAQAAQSPRKRLIVCAHVDNSYEWHWLHEGGLRLFLIGVIAPAIGGLFLLGASAASVAVFGPVGTPSGWSIYCGIAAVAFIPFYVCFYLFCDTKRVYGGAGDSLSGCAIASEAFDRLSRLKLQNTEIGVLITGGKHTGLRGGKHFAKSHKAFLGDGVQTRVIVLDRIANADRFTVWTRDRNAIVKLDAEACRAAVQACADCGVTAQSKPLYCGASDASTFAKAKFSSTCLSAPAPLNQSVSHTRNDDLSALSDDCLTVGLDIVMRFALNFDGADLTTTVDRTDQTESYAPCSE